MKTITVLGTCVLSILASFKSSASAMDSIPWVNDLETAKQLSAQTNRPILLHFWGDFCPPCKRLEAVVFPHPTVARTFSEHVIPVKVNVKHHQDLVKKYGIKRIPADVVISPSGFVLTSRQSPSTGDAYIKFCQSVHRQYVGVTEEQVQVAKQLQHANEQTVNSNREKQGLTHSQMQQQQFVGTGDRVWSGHTDTSTEHLRDGQSLVNNQTANNIQGNATNQFAGSNGASVPGFDPSNRANVVNQFAQNGTSQSSESNGTIGAQAGSGQSTAGVVAVQPKSSFNPGVSASAGNGGSEMETQQAIDTMLGTGGQSSQVNVHAQNQITNHPTNTQTVPNNASANGQYSIGDLASTDQVNETRAKMPVAQNPPQSNQQTIAQSISDRDANNAQVDANLKTASHSQGASKVVANASRYEIGLDGFCPIKLMLAQQWVKGSPEWGVVHREKTYLFSSEEALNTFMSAPDKYSPALAGFDPVVFYHKGQLEPGSREFGAFHVLDGENSSFVLCASEANRTAFKSNPEKYLNAVIQAMREVDANAGGTK